MQRRQRRSGSAAAGRCSDGGLRGPNGDDGSRQGQGIQGPLAFGDPPEQFQYTLSKVREAVTSQKHPVCHMGDQDQAANIRG